MSSARREKLYRKQSGICASCKKKCQLHQKGSKNIDLLFTIEHIIPKCLGGGNNAENVVGVCHRCNNSKGGSVPTPKFLGKLQRQAQKRLAAQT